MTSTTGECSNQTTNEEWNGLGALLSSNPKDHLACVDDLRLSFIDLDKIKEDDLLVYSKTNAIPENRDQIFSSLSLSPNQKKNIENTHPNPSSEPVQELASTTSIVFHRNHNVMDTTDSSKQKQTSQISRTPTTRSAATPSKFGTRTSQRTNLTKNPKTPQAPRALEKRTLVHTSTKHSLTHFSTPRSSTTAQTSTDRIPTNSLRSQDRNDEVISVLEKRIRALEEEIDTLKREYTAQILHIRTELMALKLRK